MRRITTSFFFLILIFLSSCTNTAHFISDKSEREIVYREFNERASKLDNDSLFNVFNKEITPLEKEALTFLYAYMPLSDIADHSGDYFLANVRYSMKAKEEMPWGKVIPEREFRHFVLPIRVNNENLDDSRKVFYEELKDRVKNLSLHDAVLEVNHWCHEKVVYTPSDSRTSSPLASVKTAYGRCGEESTFTVAALRSVGIPARQVYTPRWAHTDDNHAWVEVWIDGTWKYLGACEPLPQLNRGWFDIPATRTMLVYAKEFGKKTASDNKNFLFVTDNYVAINSISNYAPTKEIEILVTDSKNNPLENVSVQFQLYNYAEMYPLLSQQTDKNGKVFFQTGIGALDVYVSNDKNFIVRTVQPEEKGLIKIVLDRNKYPAKHVIYKVPVPGMSKSTDEQLEKENNIRIAEEDSIREKYISTFYTKEKGKEFCSKYNYPEEVSEYLINSRGNYKE